MASESRAEVMKSVSFGPSGSKQKQVPWSSVRRHSAAMKSTEGPKISKEQREGKSNRCGFREQSQCEAEGDEEVAAKTSCLYVSCVREHREEPEQHAQLAFSLRDPGNGFDRQRMKCEEEGRDHARPQGARHAPQDPKKEDAVDGVQ